MRLRHVFGMEMPVVLVVDVTVFVFQDLMLVFVLVPFGQMQPETATHQQSSQRQLKRRRFAENKDRDHRSDEGREGEVSPRSCSPQVPQRQHEQNQAHADAQKAQHRRRCDERNRC